MKFTPLSRPHQPLHVDELSYARFGAVAPLRQLTAAPQPAPPVVGALLEARAAHPGRSAFNQLLYLARTQHLPRRRVDEVLDLVGLHDVARKRVGR